jgi:hypothetical protein
MKAVSSLKLVFFNYLRKQGYDPKQMLREEATFILKDASGSFPENPEMGEVFYFYSSLYETEFSFIYNGSWELMTRSEI